jgi:WD40 repeat protein
MEGTRPDRDSILHQTGRILSSSLFANSDRMSRLLRYLVAESAADRGDQLKEYSIAQEVFQRPSTFDPRVDSTVRSEASRLRARLHNYYETEGSGDPILISIPKGSYRVFFERRPLRPDVVPTPRLYKWLALICMVVAAGAAGLWWWIGSDRRPRENKRTVRRLTSDEGLTAFPTLSTDGKLVAYASDRAGRGDFDIWMQPTSGKEAIRLTDHVADDYDPHFSPDNSQIVFRSDRDGGGIYLVPALGGQARLLARGGRRPRFSPDGRILRTRRRT